MVAVRKAPAPVKKAAPSMKDALKPATDAQPFVAPCQREPKSGCMWCPLAPYHHDFETFTHNYGRDGTKIKLKEPDHIVKSRNIREEWTEVDILFVADAPDGHEDKQAKMFVGPSKLLRNSCEEIAEVAPDRLGFTSLVRCKPPRNRDPNKTEIRACGGELIREIQARKPKLIVVLGNGPLEYLTGQTGITTLAGRFLKTTHPDLSEMTVMGCLSPGYVHRMDHEITRFLEMLSTASEFVNGRHKMLPGAGKYETLTDLKAVEAMFAKFTAMKGEKNPVAFDTETGGLSPFQNNFPRLLCFSFCNEQGVAYAVPFDHKESPWCEGGPKANEREKLKKLLIAFFTDATIPKRAQNEKFDRQHIKQALGTELAITDSDTMMTHLVINEKRGTHGLDILAYEFTGMGGYDKPLEKYKKAHKECDPERGGSYANFPGDLLFWYACADADVTWRADKGIRATDDYAKNPKFRALSEKFFPHLSATLADLEYEGAQIDSKVVDKLDLKLTADMKRASDAIIALPKVQEFVESERHRKGDVNFEFNPGSTQQLRKVLFDYYGCRPTELTDAGFERLVERHKRLSAEAENNNKQKPDFTKVLNKAIEKREWEFFSTKADVLHEYERDKNDLAPLILNYRDAEVLHGTFVEPLKHRVDDLGRVHGSFWIHGTVTGRLSSSGPNLQNIPNKGGGTIKQAYTSRFGKQGLILQVDYSQIELRIAAAWFNEPKMKAVYRNRQDLHMLTASVIARVSLEKFKQFPKDEQKKWRTRAKRVNFGVLYGGGPPALQSTLRKDGVFVTLDECQVFIDLFFKAYPGMRIAMDRLEKSVCNKGYLESFTGRRRRVPEVFSDDRELVARALRQSINFPIQSGAGDMTLMSLVLINRVLKREGFRSKAILTVHDSIVFDCHVDEYLEVALIAKEIMETLPSLSEEILPGLDWRWLDVPIVAECDVGTSWGQLVEFDPTIIRVEGTTETPLWVPDSDRPGKFKQERAPINTDELWSCMRDRLAKAV